MMFGPKPAEEWTYLERRSTLDNLCGRNYLRAAPSSSDEWFDWGGDQEARYVARWTIEAFIEITCSEWPGSCERACAITEASEAL